MRSTSMAPEQVGHVGAMAGEARRGRARPRRARLLPERVHEIAVAHDQEDGTPVRLQDPRRGLEQVAVALLLVEAADGSHHRSVLGDDRARGATRAPRSRETGRELVEGRAVPDEAHPRSRDVALAHQEVAGRAADRDRAIGERREQAVGEALVGGHAGVGEVLVQHERARPRARAASRPKSAAA